MRVHPLLLVASLSVGFARAATAEPAPVGSAASPSVSVSASASTSASAAPAKVPLRKERPPPSEVEVIDLTPDRDPQALAVGAQVGAGVLAVREGGPAQGAFNVALVGDFGLGPGGARTPWTLEPWIAFAMPFNVMAEVKGYPTRFTEFGVRIVHRWGDDSVLAHRWIALGAGAVWTNTRPSSGLFDPRNLCRNDSDRAAAEGLDCSRSGAISPGALLDLSIGLHETVVRRARWGFGVRTPVQLSTYPGITVLGFFYAQVGTVM